MMHSPLNVKFETEFRIAVSFKSMAFWDVTPCTLLAGCQFGRSCYLCLQGRRHLSAKTQQHVSEIFNQVHFSASVCVLLALVVNLFTVFSLLLAP